MSYTQQGAMEMPNATISSIMEEQLSSITSHSEAIATIRKYNMQRAQKILLTSPFIAGYILDVKDNG